MNLTQALKLKNRLAGELVRQQNILVRENARRSDSVSTVDRESVWNKVLEISNELGTLKGKIAAANVSIYPNIERMAELKSRITYLQSLPRREGCEVEFLGGNTTISHTWNSYLTSEKCDLLIEEYQKQVNQLQDDVDAYNALTTVK